MGVVDGFKSAGLFAKLSLALLSVAAMFVWISFTCTGWGESDDGNHYGLWRICDDDKHYPSCYQLDGWANDWWAASQAMVTFGFFGINVALFLTCAYMFVPKCTHNNEVAMGTAVICIVTGILYLIGVIVFGAKFTEDFIDYRATTPAYYFVSAWPEHKLSYCFGLSIVALTFEIVAGVLMILDAKKSSTTPSTLP